MQMAPHRQAQFLGCIGLQLEELNSKLKSRNAAPEPFGAPGVGGSIAKLDSSGLLSP